MISVVIDFSDKVEDFIEEPCTLYEIIFDYYVNFIFFINGMLLPLYAMISVIFFTSRMAYNSEIISILNAGVSFRRLLLPYLVAASMIAGLHALGTHFVIPWANKTRLDFEHTYIWKYNDKGKTSDVHLFTGPQTKVYIKYYQKRDSIARDIRIEEFKKNTLVSLLKAGRAEWQGPPNKWRLQNYEIRRFDGIKEEIINGQNAELDTTIELTPADFVRFLNQKEMMDTPDLVAFIDRQKARGVGAKAFEIEKHKRSAEPFTILVLTIMGVSIASRKVRGGIGLHLAMGIAIGAAFIFVARFSNVFATNDSLSAWLGVWIPNIVFSGLVIFLLLRAQK